MLVNNEEIDNNSFSLTPSQIIERSVIAIGENAGGEHL